MQQRRIANTEIDVSIISFGCWAIAGGFNWGEQDEKDSVEACRAAFESGINFFDTAEAYGRGKSEQLLAKALSDVRDEIIIASKVVPGNFRPEKLREACERSLQNLNTDRIDLYQLHWPNWNIPAADVLEVLEELKNAGKIRAYGVSNYGPVDMGECLATPYAICSNQLAYNLLFRAIEFEILPVCVKKGISVLAYSPLMQGLLTGKFNSVEDVPEDRVRTRLYSSERPNAGHDEPGAEKGMFEAVERIRNIADELGRPMADVSMAWLLAQEGVTSVIVGGRNAEQARRNVHAAELALPEDVLQALNDATEEVKDKLGSNADMWLTESRIR